MGTYAVALILIFWSLVAITVMVMTWNDRKPSAPHSGAGTDSHRGEVN